MQVYFFGDSITYGQHISPHLNYVSQIAAQLPGVTVQNCGVNGNTTRLALERMANDIQRYRPNLVFIQFGLNDCNRWQTENNVNRVNRRSFGANLAEMVDRCRHIGAASVLVTNHPTQLKPDYDMEILLYNDTIRRVANVMQIGLVDIERHISGDYLLDGLHLNQNGHNQYAKIIIASIAIWPPGRSCPPLV